ncbi:hypothetical protein BC940DRAFT_13466 [Gongronella butleri]|nr:hypothetical protein BC940DRAFT_13466 [Gongronella butleri]
MDGCRGTSRRRSAIFATLSSTTMLLAHTSCLVVQQNVVESLGKEPLAHQDNHERNAHMRSKKRREKQQNKLIRAKRRYRQRVEPRVGAARRRHKQGVYVLPVRARFAIVQRRHKQDQEQNIKVVQLDKVDMVGPHLLGPCRHPSTQ